jgi:hypothetical protein
MLLEVPVLAEKPLWPAEARKRLGLVARQPGALLELGPVPFLDFQHGLDLL